MNIQKINNSMYMIY